jgi:hypothetical protein
LDQIQEQKEKQHTQEQIEELQQQIKKWKVNRNHLVKRDKKASELEWHQE